MGSQRGVTEDPGEKVERVSGPNTAFGMPGAFEHWRLTMVGVWRRAAP